MHNVRRLHLLEQPTRRAKGVGDPPPGSTGRGSGGKPYGTCFASGRAFPPACAATKVCPARDTEARLAKVIIIDDDHDARKGLRRLLEAEGHEVEEAEDGSRALRRLVGSPADLIFTDIFMPRMDGLELVMRLREAFPEAPIIAMSGGGQLAAGPVLQAAEALGVVRSLAKPLTRGAVQEALAEALGDAV